MAAPARNDDEDIIANINITPLVDIFLVLLIIFMITSSVIDQREINISLPKAAHAGTEAPKASGLIIDKDKRMFLDGVPSDSAGITMALQSAVANAPDHEVLIAADQELAYKEIVRVIDIVRGAGIIKYALKVVRNRS
ncbi:MAG: Transport energizing protein ExbD/TolR family [Fibrobacteres bacterium]|nr:Transport energizing protein ExbD/TolR family [Fibrobacterota bacterium]